MTDEEGPKPYDVQVPIAAGRDEVWDMVTQPPLIRQWFGWDHEWLDAEIRHIFVDEATFLAPERMGWSDESFLEVTGDDDRSTVRAVSAGVAGGDPERWDPIEQGWQVFLIQLRFLLEQSPKGQRRTLHLTGTSTGRQALGLMTADWTPVGGRVAWAVDGDGHLVVVAGELPLDDPDAGPLQITVSTFGVDDAAFDEYRQTWSERWAPLARDASVTVGRNP